MSKDGNQDLGADVFYSEAVLYIQPEETFPIFE